MVKYPPLREGLPASLNELAIKTAGFELQNPEGILFNHR
jgi:hypothetical protein